MATERPPATADPVERPFALEELDLQVTLRCNLRCGFCSVRANEHAVEAMPLERIISLIREARDLGMEQLHLTGGEPALREDLEAIVAEATRLGVATRLITNGTCLDRRRLARLRDAGTRDLMVSIDGLARTHDAMRGVAGSWERAMGCVRHGVALGFRTRISAVAFQRNLHEIPLLMEAAAREGVAVFSIFLGSPLGRGQGCKEQIIGPQSWRSFLGSLRQQLAEGAYGEQMQIVAEQGFVWPETAGFHRRSLRGRGAGCATLLGSLDYLLVRGDGNLYQCVFFMHDGEPLGNVARQELGEVLRVAARQRRYAPFVELPRSCRACLRADECGGGCRGYSRLCSESWHDPDPRCEAGDRGARPGFFPLCPIAKLNLRSGRIEGSSEHALGAGQQGLSDGSGGGDQLA